jgi:hypothetical protein
LRNYKSKEKNLTNTIRRSFFVIQLVKEVKVSVTIVGKLKPKQYNINSSM